MKVKGIEINDNDYNQGKSYGIDIESELSAILADQMAKEIDREILKSMGFEPDRNKRRKNKISKINELSKSTSYTN